MTAISEKYGAMRTVMHPPNPHTFQPRGDVSLVARTYYPGCLVCQRVGTNTCEVPDGANPRSDLRILGKFIGTERFVVPDTVDGAGGAVDDDGDAYVVEVESCILGPLDTGAGGDEITAADLYSFGYVFDNNTVYKTDVGGDLSAPVRVMRVDNNGKVFVWATPFQEGP